MYLVRFDPALGAEIKKTRPALVLQNDILNRYSSITIVAAIISKIKAPKVPFYLTKVLIKAPEGGLISDSVVLLDQIHSFDKQRLVKRLGRVKSETMEEVDRALMISLGLVKI